MVEQVFEEKGGDGTGDMMETEVWMEGGKIKKDEREKRNKWKKEAKR